MHKNTRKNRSRFTAFILYTLSSDRSQDECRPGQCLWRQQARRSSRRWRHVKVDVEGAGVDRGRLRVDGFGPGFVCGLVTVAFRMRTGGRG